MKISRKWTDWGSDSSNSQFVKNVESKIAFSENRFKETVELVVTRNGKLDRKLIQHTLGDGMHRWSWSNIAGPDGKVHVAKRRARGVPLHDDYFRDPLVASSERLLLTRGDMGTLKELIGVTHDVARDGVGGINVFPRGSTYHDAKKFLLLNGRGETTSEIMITKNDKSCVIFNRKHFRIVAEEDQFRICNVSVFIQRMDEQQIDFSIPEKSGFVIHELKSGILNQK